MRQFIGVKNAIYKCFGKGYVSFQEGTELGLAKFLKIFSLMVKNGDLPWYS